MSLSRVVTMGVLATAAGLSLGGGEPLCLGQEAAGAAPQARDAPGREVTPPYPPSRVITGVTFDPKTLRTEAPGSDIWATTWAADGHLYTTFGDGGGFGGTNSDGRVSLGVARVEGGPDDYRGVNVAGGKGATHPAPFTGKSLGILALGHILYLWRNGSGSDQRAFESNELWRSDDHGGTWRPTGVAFAARRGDFPPGDHGFFAVAFCQFGRGYAGARDDYVYLYAPEVIDPNGNTLPPQSPGNSQPGNLFTFDAKTGTYQFNVKTKGYAPGRYVLNFRVGNDPALYSVTFLVR